MGPGQRRLTIGLGPPEGEAVKPPQRRSPATLPDPTRDTLSSMTAEVPLPPHELRMGGAHFLDDDDFRSAARSDVRYLVEHCGLRPTSRVLDVGCGPGRLAIGLLTELGGVGRYVGVDVQARHIDWCRKHLAMPGMAFVLNDAPNERYNPGGADGFTLPEDDAFDVIHAYSLFSHMRSSDVEAYLRVFRHHLADDGRVFLTAFVEPDVPHEEENPIGYGAITWTKPLHCMRYEEDYFVALISRAGLAVERCDRGIATDGQSAYVLSARGGRGAFTRRELRHIGEQQLADRELIGLQQRCRLLETQRTALLEQLEVASPKRAERNDGTIPRRDPTIRQLEKRLQAAEQTLSRRSVRVALRFSSAVPRRSEHRAPDRVRGHSSVDDGVTLDDRVGGPRQGRGSLGVTPTGATGVDVVRQRSHPDPPAVDPSELVVYSALVHAYDDLPSVAQFEDSAVRFVCFADVAPTDSRGWEIFPLNYYSNDPKRSVLFLKTHPHVYFPDRQFTLWCDASIQMTRSPIDLLGDWGLGDADVAAFLHSERDCVYDEAAEVVELQLDLPGLVEGQMARYEAAGYPRNNGLHETGFLFRRHNDADVVQFDERWWCELESGSRRDQLSFDVVAWRSSISVRSLTPRGWSVRNYPGLHKKAHLASRTFRRPRNLDTSVLERRAHNLTASYGPGLERRADAGGVDVDVVIPVHNALAHVQRCVRSVMDDPEWAGRLILVDDGSREATREWCRELADREPRIQLLRHDDARGFPGACNAGLFMSHSSCVAVLNSDTVVSTGWLSKMRRVLDWSPSLGIVGPLSNAASWQSVPQIRASDGSLAVNSLPVGVSVEEMNIFLEELTCDLAIPLVPTLNGFCFLVRREVVERLGGFDEVAFPRGYGEEVDLTLRATDSGYLCGVALDTYVYHAKSQSFSTAERNQLKVAARNTLIERYGEERLNRIAASTRQHPALEFVRDAVERLFERTNATVDDQPRSADALA